MNPCNEDDPCYLMQAHLKCKLRLLALAVDLTIESMLLEYKLELFLMRGKQHYWHLDDRSVKNTFWQCNQNYQFVF